MDLPYVRRNWEVNDNIAGLNNQIASQHDYQRRKINRIYQFALNVAKSSWFNGVT